MQESGRAPLPSHPRRPNRADSGPPSAGLLFGGAGTGTNHAPQLWESSRADRPQPVNQSQSRLLRPTNFFAPQLSLISAALPHHAVCSIRQFPTHDKVHTTRMVSSTRIDGLHCPRCSHTHTTVSHPHSKQAYPRVGRCAAPPPRTCRTISTPLPKTRDGNLPRGQTLIG